MERDDCSEYAGRRLLVALHRLEDEVRGLPEVRRKAAIRLVVERVRRLGKRERPPFRVDARQLELGEAPSQPRGGRSRK